MEHSGHDPATQGRSAWNAGRKLGAKRALKPQQVWAIRGYRQAEDQRSCRRRSCPQPGHRHSAKDRPASAVRASRACSHQHPGMAGGPGWNARRRCVPEQARRHHAHQHPAVCAVGRRVGRGHRSAERGLRHPLPASNKGVVDRQADRQPACRSDPARPCKDREPVRGCYGMQRSRRPCGGAGR